LNKSKLRDILQFAMEPWITRLPQRPTTMLSNCLKSY